MRVCRVGVSHSCDITELKTVKESRNKIQTLSKFLANTAYLGVDEFLVLAAFPQIFKYIQ